MRSFSLTTFSACIALALGGVSQAHAGLITNGTFTGTGGLASLAGWTPSTLGVSATSESAFSVCCGGINARANNLAQFGGGGTSGGTLSQTFATTTGQTYNLSFMYGSFGDNERQSLAVSVGNLTSSVSDATGSSDFNTLFGAEGFVFTAVAATSTLLFTDTSTVGSSADGLLENVSVVPVSVAVPEPASLSVLALGLVAALGLATRRQGGQATA